MMKQTKLDVITGFLGAGKTTLLSRYTRWLKDVGQSFCVIENEFGAAGIDGALLAGQGAAVREISGGCVCCTLKVTLYELLRSLDGQVDRIVLEPSGLFCGDDLLDILRSPELRVRPGMWVGLIDPLAIDAMNEEDRTVLASELYAAGSVVISKAQLASEEEIALALELIAALSPMPTVWTKPWDTLEDDCWFTALQAAGMVERDHERRRFDHTGMFQSTCLRPGGTVPPQLLRVLLKQSMSAGQVSRIKGWVGTEDGVLSVNCTPGCIHWDDTPVWEDRPIVLNVIGRKLDRHQLQAIWREYL